MPHPLAQAADAVEMVVLPLKLIHEPQQALRGPERTDPKYAELRESVREKGVLLPILVRPDPENPGEHILIDGMQRFTLSKETGRTTIPARVLHVTAIEGSSCKRSATSTGSTRPQCSSLSCSVCSCWRSQASRLRSLQCVCKSAPHGSTTPSAC